MNNCIHLFTGGYFSFECPETSVYTIEDVAHNLSHINRFTGSSEVAYNVAQHSLYVSLYLEQQGYPVSIQLAGLMHDAVEFATGDVSKPLKTLLPDYRKIEYRCEKAILKKYGIDFPLASCIKDADNAVFVAERKYLQPNCPQGLIYNGKNVEAVPFVIVPWDAAKSKREFLKRFYELGGEYK
jgi:5'-deoxynucleotidase YfbR-like HD superfamily hydrolase